MQQAAAAAAAVAALSVCRTAERIVFCLCVSAFRAEAKMYAVDISGGGVFAWCVLQPRLINGRTAENSKR